MLRSAATLVFAQSLWGAATAADVTLCGKTYSHQWLTKTAMPVKRSDMTATTVGEAIYLVGGCGMDQIWTPSPQYPGYTCGGGVSAAISNKVTSFHPLTNEHKTKADAPRGRYRHAAAAVGTKIYLFGGTSAAEAIVKEIDVYDTAANTWSTLSWNDTKATTDNAAFAHDGKIYVLGGYDENYVAQTSVRIFDPSVTGAAAFTDGPAMKQSRGDFSAIVVNDTALVVGGYHHGNDFKMPVASVERLDKGATGWVVRKEMSVARGDKAVAALNGAMHVVGGETKNADGHSIPLSDVEVYHPDCNEWQAGGQIPSKRFRFTAAAYGTSLYIFGGQGYLDGTYGTAGSKYPLMDTVEEYSETVKPPETVDGAATMCQGLLALLAPLALALGS